MEVIFRIEMGGDLFDFPCKWSIPHFPRVGDNVELESILDPDIWEQAKNTTFSGKNAYEGLTLTLAQIFMNCYNITVKSINWMKYSAEVQITTDLYDLSDWKEIT